VTLLALPFIAVVAAMLGTGVFAPRYALGVVLAPAALLPLALHRLARGRGWLILAFLVPFGLALVHQAVAAVVFHRSAPAVMTRYPLLREVPGSPLPIAIGNGHVFMRVWQYGPEALRERIVFLNDIEVAARIEGSDTLARDFDGFRRWFPVPVVDEQPFLQTHREFWVHDVEFGWLVPRLLELGATLEVRGRDGDATLYLARMPG
jgi:hypothetical protein